MEDMAIISLANYDDALSAAKEKSGNPAPMTSAELGPRIRSIRTDPADPHTLLLIHGDKIEDASIYGVPLTNNGVVVSPTQSKFGGKSLYFNGESWINFPERYAAYRDEDFTIDWWEYCTTTDVPHQVRYFSTDHGGVYKIWGLLLGHMGEKAFCGNGWDMINAADMFNVVQNQWVHWATVRSGNTLYTFRNGVKFAQTPIVGSIPYDEKTAHCIGGWRYSPGQKWIGYMSEFRISNVARWTSDFTPPDKPYDNAVKPVETIQLDVTENGTYTAESGKAYNPVNVKTPGPKPEEAFLEEFTFNGTYPISPAPGRVFSGGSVRVNTPTRKPEQTKSVTYTTNGQRTVTPDNGKVLSSVSVNVNCPVPKVEQEKTVSVTKNGPVSVTPDAGKVLSKATVEVNVQGGFPNGTKWLSNWPRSMKATSVYKGNGVWVATFKNGLWYSTDGKNWEQTSRKYSSFSSVYYAKGIWVSGCGGFDGDKGLLYSLDGVKWEYTNVYDGNWPSVYCAGGIWVAGGEKGIKRSTDGKTWEYTNVYDREWPSVYNADGLWVAGGKSGLLYSTDGLSWTPPTSSPSDVPVKRVYNADGLWVACCDGKGILHSADGLNWTQSDKADGVWNAVYKGNGVWVAGGIGTGLWYSTDGTKWTQSDKTDENWNYIYYANGMWVACSENGLWNSTDGMKWTQSEYATDNYHFVHYADGLWVSCDDRGVDYSVAWEPS